MAENDEPGSVEQSEALDQNLKSQVESNQQLNQDLGIGVERRKETLRIQKQILQEMNLQFEASKKQVKLNTENLSQLESMAVKAAQLVENLKKGKGSVEELNKQQAKMTTLLEELNEQNGISEELNEKIAKALEKGTVASLKEAAKLFGQARGQAEDLEGFQAKVSTHTADFAKTLGIAANVGETRFGKMNEFFKDIQKGDTAGKLNAMIDSFTQMVHPLNIAASLFDEIIRQVGALEKASIGFSKATGFTRSFDNAIVNTTKSINMAGGTMADAGSSLQDLATGMSNFANLSRNAQIELSVLNFRLKNIGVTNANKLFEIFNRNLRNSSSESQRLTRDLILSGTAAGITAQEMATNFESTFSSLAVNGSRATEVFKDLAAQAKTAGVAVSDLINLGKDFDTFAAGAEKAGKLNAILGTQISHMRMLNMSDEQRSMEMIKQIKMRVGDFDALSRSEKLYIAQAIAGGDVAKAQKLINMSTAEYLAKKDKMAASVKTQEELKKMTEMLVPAMEKLKMAFVQLALELSPIITAFTKVLNLISFLSPLIGALAVGFMTYFTIVKGGAIILAAYKGIQEVIAFVELVREQRLAGLTLWTSITTVATNLYNISTKTTLGIILALAAGIAYLVYIMTKPNSPPFYLIFGVAALGVFLFNKALSAGGPKAMLLALALGFLAGMVSLIFYGIGFMAEKMTDFVKSVGEAPGAILEAAGGIYILANAMAALALATLTFRFSAFTEFAKSIGSMGKGMTQYASALEKIKSVSSELAGAMGDTLVIGSVEGGKTTVAVGKNAAVASMFSNNKLTIDVKMPKIEFPKPVIKVYLDGNEIRNIVQEEMSGTRI